MAVRYLTPAGECRVLLRAPQRFHPKTNENVAHLPAGDDQLAIRDNYPVTELHTLVIPKRHATTFFDLFEPERRAINQLLDGLRLEIMKKDASVSGFAAGQTIRHAHVHLIPRRQGDVLDPTGGVRGVIPGKATY